MDDSPAPNQIIAYRTVGDATLHLHVYRPPSPPVGSRAAVVFFFGGGWQGGNVRHFSRQARHLAGLGLVAFCAEYRTETGHGVPPSECVRDAKAAVRWVRAHAMEWNIAPDRIVAGGGSAGAHLAAAAAALAGFDDAPSDPVSCVPNALLLFNPVIDNGPGGYGHDRVANYWREFSPLHNIRPGFPPTLVQLGTHDRLVPVQAAEEFRNRIRAVGGRCELRLYEGQGHGFFNVARYTETLHEAAEFLRDLGFLQEGQ